MKGDDRYKWVRGAPLWLAALLAFVALAVAAGLVTPFPGESAAFRSLQGMRSAGLDDAALVVSWTAGATVGALTLAAIALAFAAARRWPEVVAVPVLLATEGIGYVVKLLVARPRPLAILGVESSHSSFPSGHALHAFLLFGFLIYLVEGQVRPRWVGRALQAALAVPLVAVGLSRVYLGQHWPSDVAGSYLLGVTGLGLAAWVGKRALGLRRRRCDRLRASSPSKEALG